MYSYQRQSGHRLASSVVCLTNSWYKHTSPPLQIYLVDDSIRCSQFINFPTCSLHCIWGCWPVHVRVIRTVWFWHLCLHLFLSFWLWLCFRVSRLFCSLGLWFLFCCSSLLLGRCSSDQMPGPPGKYYSHVRSDKGFKEPLQPPHTPQTQKADSYWKHSAENIFVISTKSCDRMNSFKGEV